MRVSYVVSDAVVHLTTRQLATPALRDSLKQVKRGLQYYTLQAPCWRGVCAYIPDVSGRAGRTRVHFIAFRAAHAAWGLVAALHGGPGAHTIAAPAPYLTGFSG